MSNGLKKALPGSLEKLKALTAERDQLLKEVGPEKHVLLKLNLNECDTKLPVNSLVRCKAKDAEEARKAREAHQQEQRLVRRVRSAVDAVPSKQAEEELPTATAVKKKAYELDAHMKPWRCSLCPSDFATRWETNRHGKTCRLPNASRVVIQKGVEARCDICKMKFTSATAVREHIYWMHNRAAIMGAYRRPLEGMMEARELKRARNR
jgi:hypothetical protein